VDAEDIKITAQLNRQCIKKGMDENITLVANVETKAGADCCPWLKVSFWPTLNVKTLSLKGKAAAFGRPVSMIVQTNSGRRKIIFKLSVHGDIEGYLPLGTLTAEHGNQARGKRKYLFTEDVGVFCL